MHFTITFDGTQHIRYTGDIVIIEDHYIGVSLCEVFHKGKVDLNLVKFETRSII